MLLHGIPRLDHSFGGCRKEGNIALHSEEDRLPENTYISFPYVTRFFYQIKKKSNNFMEPKSSNFIKVKLFNVLHLQNKRKALINLATFQTILPVFSNCDLYTWEIFQIKIQQPIIFFLKIDKESS